MAEYIEKKVAEDVCKTAPPDSHQILSFESIFEQSQTTATSDMEGKVTWALTGVSIWVWEKIYESEHDSVILKKKNSKK